MSLSNKQSADVKSSKFLDHLYNTPGEHDKLKSAIENFVLKQVEKRRQEIEIDKNYGTYRLPLGFRKPMMLSEIEEKAIAAAILQMARNIHDGLYSIHNDCTLVHIDVEDRQQRDVPMPYIQLTIKCPRAIEPKHGFYLSGIFKKEKILREIVEAHINKIVFHTEDWTEKLLMTL